MRPPIKDEFQHLKISKQRKYQLRKRRDRCCVECGRPADGGASRCLEHLVDIRERLRAAKGATRRRRSLSYLLQEQAESGTSHPAQPSPSAPVAQSPSHHRAIKDEIQHLKVSRQRKYQLRKQRDRLCRQCGAPTGGATLCPVHQVEARERQRVREGSTRRYSTPSYRLQPAAKHAPKQTPS